MGGKARLVINLLWIAAISAAALTAQTANQAWLRYQNHPGRILIPLNVRALGPGILEQSALSELNRAMADLNHSSASLSARAREVLGGEIVLGTAAEVHKAYPKLTVPTNLQPESFWLYWNGLNGDRSLSVIAGGGQPGVLYGAFAFLRFAATEHRQKLADAPYRDQPAYSIRWVDEWDNPDGSIERGYAGRSIFFEGGNVREDLAPVSEYARLLASIGVNGCNINNVNAAPQLLDSVHLKQIARIADAFRPWGVHVALSVAIASPQTIGGLPTYDPLDPAVKAWWAAKVSEIYTLIPDFAGFTVKADSEGQPGPSSFGRTPADAANTLVAALAPHGGVVLYRAFVYNHHLDWHDPKADRARAAYDIFHPLDGKFLPNVIVQTKEGPIDFQVREPVSPLFAGLPHTAQAMEVQITQEYTGQQRHLVYLAPMWKWVLDTHLGAPGPSHLGIGERTPVKTILEGQTFHPPLGGLVGVAGIGRDRWLNSPLALVNLYAFGRLAWNPNLDPAEIADEWIKQSISTDTQVVATVQKMLMQSWPAYESYTGPLGLQTLTDITGSHYGPNIESSERNGWGQWHDADAQGVGKDRTVATGSGYVGQYPPELAKVYEDPATTPDDLFLFFHHVPYTYKLHDGKTIIQYLYDSHYDGAARAAQFVRDWQSLQGKVDLALYADVLARLKYQAGHAIVWRDAVVQYFLKLSGIPDDQGRAGHYPGRLEAEDAHLTGYKIIDVTPWEDASRGKAVSCPSMKPTGLSMNATGLSMKDTALSMKGMGLSMKATSLSMKATALSMKGKGLSMKATSLSMKATALSIEGMGFSMKGTGFSPYINQPENTGASAPEGTRTCSAEWTWNGSPGLYNIAAQYFDLPGGTAKFTLLLNGHNLDSWSADADLPSHRPNGDNSTRRTIPNIDLKPGDILRVDGTPDGPDPAVLDYIEITPTSPAH